VGKNRVKKKSLILGMDSGKTPLFSMFNVDSYDFLYHHVNLNFTGRKWPLTSCAHAQC